MMFGRIAVGPLSRAAGLKLVCAAAAMIVAAAFVCAGDGQALTVQENGLVPSINHRTVPATRPIVPMVSEACPPLGLRAAADRFDAIATDIDKVTGFGALTKIIPTRGALKADAVYLRQMARCLREQSQRWGIP